MELLLQVLVASLAGVTVYALAIREALATATHRIALAEQLPVVIFEVQPTEDDDFVLCDLFGGGIDPRLYPIRGMRGKRLSKIIPSESGVWQGWRAARRGKPTALVHVGSRDNRLYATAFRAISPERLGAATVYLGHEDARRDEFMRGLVRMGELIDRMEIVV